MAPFSVPTLCVTSSKNLYSMYQYIKDVVNIQHQTEDLSTELCAFDTSRAASSAATKETLKLKPNSVSDAQDAFGYCNQVSRA